MLQTPTRFVHKKNIFYGGFSGFSLVVALCLAFLAMSVQELPSVALLRQPKIAKHFGKLPLQSRPQNAFVASSFTKQINFYEQTLQTPINP